MNRCCAPQRLMRGLGVIARLFYVVLGYYYYYIIFYQSRFSQVPEQYMSAWSWDYRHGRSRFFRIVFGMTAWKCWLQGNMIHKLYWFLNWLCMAEHTPKWIDSTPLNYWQGAMRNREQKENLFQSSTVLFLEIWHLCVSLLLHICCHVTCQQRLSRWMRRLFRTQGHLDGCVLKFPMSVHRQFVWVYFRIFSPLFCHCRLGYYFDNKLDSGAQSVWSGYLLFNFCVCTWMLLGL